MPNAKPVQFYEFDSFRLSAGEGVLLRGGKSLPLTPKAFETLLVLIENRGQIVSREAMMRRVWNDCYVEENCLTKNISTLRKVLGEDKCGEARFIETVPRRGYRFVAAVSETRETETKKIVGSLAVLPFKVFGAKTGAEYLGLGLADILITRLSNLRQIVVRPTSAVRKYETTEFDAAEIGRELQVDWVLDGNLFQTGERVRVTVQFIGVSEARPLWGERLDEESADLIGVQDSIAEKVARTLIERLEINAEQEPLNKLPTADNEAFREYLEGRFYWNKRTAEAMKKAAACFARAIEIDPKFALAHAGLGDAYLLSSQFALLTPQQCFPQAKTAALTAIKLDSTLAEAHATLGHVAFLFEWNWRQAEIYYRRAIELNPNYATARNWFGGFLRSMNRLDEAVHEISRALELDPLSPVVLKNLGVTLCLQKRFDEAIKLSLKAIELAPDYALGYRSLGWIYLQKGLNEDAVAALEKAALLSNREPAILSALGCAYAAANRTDDAIGILRELDEFVRRAHVSKYDIAQIFIRLGDFDKAFELLEKAFKERDISMVLLAVDPDLDELRRESRFRKLLKSIELDF
ncbi:MAG: Adenylate cyclase [uncultured Pyrinomonadaceae bacterium]|uniref:Adenylate cyclase n=1 Tax=uncultured Pyrinomonadaceae bacterium TaxID=2283094 RepID=A0A6J4NZW1_9BACT|nr:MAG: Adenylate cyclase [uncultured Pyrinomonadaceae bacterium]